MGDRWSPLILRDLYLGVDRFDELVTDLGISRNLLSDRLGHLVDHGVVERRRYQERPARDRFVLTDAGAELVPVLIALTAWGDRWRTPPDGPPLRFHHEGHRCEPVVTCSTCSAPLSSTNVQPVPGPGGRSAPGTALVGRVVPRPRSPAP
jgi:DNA-binding HxlR family transcriptional regulator